MKEKNEEEKWLYALALWTTKPRKEDVFRVAWEDFARWTAENVTDALDGRLVQDVRDPRLFISFGQRREAETM
jgi:hypothetical protein